MGRSDAVRRLSRARDGFCGMGTRRAKLQLNRRAKVCPIARALRLALEIEDASTLGKKYGSSTWGYRSYEKKQTLIHELIELCKQQRWEYGKHRTSDGGPRYIVYFHLPHCEQISFHTDLNVEVPDYLKEWDGKVNSTLDKLEAVVSKLLSRRNYES
jgi:hypothetical protein